MEWKTIARSRYLITYDEKNQEIYFILAGATKDGRQDLYAKLVDAMRLLRTEELVSYKDADKEWVNISADIFTYHLKTNDDKSIHLIGVPHTSLAERMGTEIDLGIIPKEENFATDVLNLWNQYNPSSKNRLFELKSIKFDQWSGNTVLLSVTLRIDSKTTLKDIAPKIEASIKNDAILKSEGYNLQFPNVVEVESWEQLKQYIFAQTSSLYLIKQLSKREENDLSIASST